MPLTSQEEAAAAVLSQAICRYICDDDPISKAWIQSGEFSYCCKLLELNCKELRKTITEAHAIGKPVGSDATGVVPNPEPCNNVEYAKIFNRNRTRKISES